MIVPPFLPDTPACRAELAQYYESVSRVDAGLGRLIEILKQAGKYDDTLIIYISDNGMPFPARKRPPTSRDSACRASCAIRRRKNAARQRGDGELGRYRAHDSRFRRRRAAARAIAFHGRSFLPILEQREAAPAGTRCMRRTRFTK